MISIIVAVSDDFAIGKNNQLLWHIPAELQYFKQRTLEKSIIMGRKTFNSIGKPLPKRQNIVITSRELDVPGIIPVRTLDEAIEIAESEEKIIIGGGQIYRLSLPLVDKLYLTQVHMKFPDADVYFPRIYKDEWHVIDAGYFPENDTTPAYTTKIMIRK